MINLDQYQAARCKAVLLDRSDRGRIVLRGHDRKSFLHALLTNDIAVLAPGTGCYAALLTASGRMMADMHVLELGDVTLLDVHGGVKDMVLAKLDQLIFTEDVQLGDVTGKWGCLGVYGPQAPAVVGRVAGGQSSGAAVALTEELAGSGNYHNRRIEVLGDIVVAARVDEFGLPGIWMFADLDRCEALGASLEAAGAVRMDAGVASVLRIEAGEPAFGAELTDDIIPLEAGIEQRAISFTKGCYPGQEIVIRILHRGHGKVLRKLVGLAVGGDTTSSGGDTVPSGGNPVPSGGNRVEKDGKDVGGVTSAAYSPRLGRPIALAYVHRDYLEPGTSLQIKHADVTLNATVSALPFA